MDQEKQQATSPLVEVHTSNDNKNTETLNIERVSEIQLECDTNVNSSMEFVSVDKSQESISDGGNDGNSRRKLIDETQATVKCSTCGIEFENLNEFNRHYRFTHLSSEEKYVESQSLRHDTGQTEVSMTSTHERGNTQTKGNDKDAMGSAQILHGSFYQMPPNERHDVKGDFLLKMMPTTQTINHPSFEFLSGRKSPKGVIHDPLSQHKTTPLLKSLLSNPYHSLNKNMDNNTSSFTERQKERSILLQKIKTFLHTLKQDIHNILEKIRTENNATKIVQLQIKFKELLEKQRMFQNNYQYLIGIGKKPSQNLNIQQEIDQFHQNQEYQYPQRSFVPVVPHPYVPKVYQTFSQGYQGLNSIFNHNGKRPYEETADTDEGNQSKLVSTSAQTFPNHESNNFTEGITDNVMQLPFHSNVTSFPAEKDHLYGAMQTDGATCRVNATEPRYDKMKEFQTGMAPLPFLKPSPRLSQIPCTITRPQVHDNAPSISNEKDKFVVPLLDLKKVDQRVLEFLNEKNIDCFIPVQGNSMLGIPIMRISMDAWRVCFSNSDGEIGGTETYTSHHLQ